MTLTTPLTELFAIEHPILLAPMAGVSGGALAAAVTEAGGLGLIGGGYGDKEWLEAEFTAARGRRVGVGFITWSLAEAPGLLNFALGQRPQAVMLSFGDAAPFARAVREAGARLLCQVQTVDDARAAAALGADVIVAQGTEAGGHGATRTTFTLVPAVVDAVDPVPVVAAGGVADGRGLAAALILGAAGVLVGTRFYATRESLGHGGAKARIVEATGDRTLRTRVFDLVRGKDWPEPYTGRVIANDFSTRWHGREAALQGDLEAQRAAYADALVAGDFGTAAVFAGEAVDLIHDIPPAPEQVTRLVAEAERALGRWR